jgi:hypothetical protein
MRACRIVPSYLGLRGSLSAGSKRSDRAESDLAGGKGGGRSESKEEDGVGELHGVDLDLLVIVKGAPSLVVVGRWIRSENEQRKRQTTSFISYVLVFVRMVRYSTRTSEGHVILPAMMQAASVGWSIPAATSSTTSTANLASTGHWTLLDATGMGSPNNFYLPQDLKLKLSLHIHTGILRTSDLSSTKKKCHVQLVYTFHSSTVKLLWRLNAFTIET